MVALFYDEKLEYQRDQTQTRLASFTIFETPSALPCHTLSPFALTSLPPCHHPNSDKLFDPKLAKESLGMWSNQRLSLV